MERVYHTINEIGAEIAQNMMSFNDYKEGSKTAEYKEYVDRAYELADKIATAKPEQAERVYVLAARYSKNMARYMNQDIHIGCMCPSVMISGPANFPFHKKEKQLLAWEKNHQFFEDVQGILSKMENILYGKEQIKAGDEDAIKKLEKKLKNLKEQQEFMKAVNAYYRKHKTIVGCSELTKMQEKALQVEMEKDFHYEDKPFMSYELSNNNQNIHSTENRLKRLKATKDNGISETENQFFKIVENSENMRLQLFFKDKPKEKVRKILKRNGFHWAPSQEAWQRQLTSNAKYALLRVIEQLQIMQKED